MSLPKIPALRKMRHEQVITQALSTDYHNGFSTLQEMAGGEPIVFTCDKCGQMPKKQETELIGKRCEENSMNVYLVASGWKFLGSDDCPGKKYFSPIQLEEEYSEEEEE